MPSTSKGRLTIGSLLLLLLFYDITSLRDLFSHMMINKTKSLG